MRLKLCEHALIIHCCFVTYMAIFIFSVANDTTSMDEPKFITFWGMLVQLFKLFCFNCKAEHPTVKVFRCGTMAKVRQVCECCIEGGFSWNSQPYIHGHHPAGNILTSFGILTSGKIYNFGLVYLNKTQHILIEIDYTV